MIYSRAKTFMRVLPTRWRRKPAGIDTELNYFTATVCICCVLSADSRITTDGRGERAKTDREDERCWSILAWRSDDRWANCVHRRSFWKGELGEAYAPEPLIVNNIFLKPESA